MELIVLLLVAAALRVLFWTSHSTDDMVHLWNTRLRKKHGNIKSHEPLDSVVPGKRGYATLAHYFVCLFPEPSWRFLGKSLNVGYDLVLVALTWGMGKQLPPMAHGIDPAFFAAALVATSPVLMPITSRVKSMGGRTLGCIFVFGYFNALWLGMTGHWMVGLFLCVMCALLVVLTSKFALQAILFMTPLIAFFSWHPFPLVVLGIAVAATFFVPGLGLRDVLSFMYAHSRWYLRNGHKGTTASARNRWQDIFELPAWFKTNKDIFFGILFRRSSYFIGLYSFPLFWLVLLWLVKGAGSDYLMFASVVTLASFTVFFLTSLGPFLFLGQAERYFEYAVPFAALVSAGCLQNNLIGVEPLFGLILFQVAMCMVNCIYTHYALIKQAVSTTKRGRAHEFMSQCNGLRVLTIPTKLAFDFSSMTNNHLYYYRAVNTPENGLLYKEEDYAWFEMPRDDLGHFITKYGIDTVIALKSFLPETEERGLDYGLGTYPILYEDNTFLIVSLIADKNGE